MVCGSSIRKCLRSFIAPLDRSRDGEFSFRVQVLHVVDDALDRWWAMNARCLVKFLGRVVRVDGFNVTVDNELRWCQVALCVVHGEHDVKHLFGSFH